MGIKYRKNGKNGRLTAQERRLVNRRLRVIKMAAKLGNVSDACRIGNMDRPSFYRYKRRYDLYGISGLRNLSTAPHHRPRSISQKVKSRIAFLARRHPQWGCNQVADALKSEGYYTSHKSVQKTFIRNDLRTIADRQKYASRQRGNVVFL